MLTVLVLNRYKNEIEIIEIVMVNEKKVIENLLETQLIFWLVMNILYINIVIFNENIGLFIADNEWSKYINFNDKVSTFVTL